MKRVKQETKETHDSSYQVIFAAAFMISERLLDGSGNLQYLFYLHGGHILREFTYMGAPVKAKTEVQSKGNGISTGRLGYKYIPRYLF